jgi:hypothetical protein
MITVETMEAKLHSAGFDLSEGLSVRCSRCEAVVINGVPCHERNCPNEVIECEGCNNKVPKGVRYCQDCS